MQGTMRLAFLNHGLQAGGAERMIVRLADYAARQGTDVTVVTTDGREPFYTLPSAVHQIRLSIAGASQGPVSAVWNNLKRIRELRKAYRRCRPDVVVCMFPSMILLSRLARGNMKYKLIGAECSNPFTTASGFWGWSKGWISACCDGFLFQTERARRYYPARTRKRSIILSNGIAVSDYAAQDRPWQEREGICAAGRMIPGKCFDDLLTAFAGVLRRHPEARLDVYGDGPQRGELEALRARLGLEKTVTFCGRCAKMPEEYARHKVFAMPSEREGMPNVLLEAMASGCACVSTDCDFGPAELISDGDNGFLVPVHDAEAMTQRVNALLEDDTLCRRLGETARGVRTANDMEAIGKKFCAYLELVRNDRRAEHGTEDT